MPTTTQTATPVNTSVPPTPHGQNNSPPQVSILGPASGTEFQVGNEIIVVFAATDVTGAIFKAEIYAGDEKLGEVVNPASPQSFKWTNATPGNHAVSVKVINEQGISAESTVLNLAVLSAEQQTISTLFLPLISQ